MRFWTEVFPLTGLWYYEVTMNIEEIRIGDKLQLNVDGKIDSFSSQEFQNAVLSGFQKSKDLIINLEKVKHITSIGLRALLLGKKTADSKGGSLTVINPNEDVKEIFRVTGFDSILSIR